MSQKWKDNKLQTKQEVRQLVIDLWKPLAPYYSKGNALVFPKGASALYPDFIAGMETFSRVIWGVAPLLTCGNEPDMWQQHLQGIIHGTNPECEEYWGRIKDYDQRIVEMAAFGYALCLVPEKVWEPLSEEQKKNLENWLVQVNDYQTPDCNWILFTVIVNLGLKKVGAAYSQEVIEDRLDRLETYYIGNGWYRDGVVAHVDYYTPFAIHYDCLFYAALMEKEDPERARKYKDRAARFAEDFIYWFGEDGSALPYGRSMTYRFAQASFWSALAFAKVDVFQPGVLKGLILRNLRYWLKQDIFQPDDTLSVGYHYPNLIMSETYNAPGSPYWGLKIMLILALDEASDFWQATEEALPSLDKSAVQKEVPFVIKRDHDSNHVAAFHTGNLHTNEHAHTAAKYEKFVYSNRFGFSIPRGEWGLEQGAYDSMLAVSEQDMLYRVKRKVEEREINDDFLYFKWKPWNDVTIKTWLIPGLPWHLRIHQIETNRNLDVADGGFAIDTSKEDAIIEERSDHVKGIGTYLGLAGAVDLLQKGKTRILYPNANTNLLYKKTALPTVEHRLEKGKHLLVHAFYGHAHLDKQTAWKDVPFVEGDTIYLREGMLICKLDELSVDRTRATVDRVLSTVDRTRATVDRTHPR